VSEVPRIAVVNYGAGNLRSVAKALARSGLLPDVTSDPARVREADGVVLPGVGAFADAMAGLRQRGLDAALRAVWEKGTPYLGLCLGLQLLFEWSDEHGRSAGFGVFRGGVERFSERDPRGEKLRVPHIGWNKVEYTGRHPLLAALPPADCYYFVHAYRALPCDNSLVVGSAEYGGAFAAAVAGERIFAVQFHPEKSQAAGKQLLDAFAQWVQVCRN